MNTTNRPPASEISFAPHCFVQDGTREEYVVSRSALHSGPATFTSRVEADAYAAKTRRAVTVRVVPVMRRVSWK